MLLYWGFNFLKGHDVFSNERIFIAVYDDVAGLEKTNPVTVNGLNVGQVRNMEFSTDGQAKVVIELVLKNTLAIPSNSTAKIISSDLLGSKAVEITLGTSIQLAQPGDPLISAVDIRVGTECPKRCLGTRLMR